MPEYTGRPSEGEGISLFMPAFNEEQNVAFMIGCARNALDALGVPWEIVIVFKSFTRHPIRLRKALIVFEIQ